MDSGTGFSWKFSGQCYMFFCPFSGVPDWIVLILVWFDRSLRSAQVSRQSCPWPLKMMTSQVVEGRCICTDSFFMGSSGANRLIKKPQNRLLPIFFTWFYIKWSGFIVLCWKMDFSQKAWYFTSPIRVWKFCQKTCFEATIGDKITWDTLP